MYAFDLSFDPADPLFDGPGDGTLRWGLQVFTTANVYALDPERTSIEVAADRSTLVADALAQVGQQRRGLAGRVRATVVSTPDGALEWQVDVDHPEPVKSVKLVLRGLPEAALGHGWWQATSMAGLTTHPAPYAPLRWRYPWPDDDPWPEWETPWACAGDAATGAVALSVRDTQVRPVRLFASAPPWAGGETVVEVVTEEDATRWDGSYATPTIRLRSCASQAEIDADLAAHLAWLEHAHGLPRWEARTDVPPWFHEVRLVVNVHGRHWTGHVFHTYEAMGDVLRFVADHVPGHGVLAYLPGWEGRYYHDYPTYRPDPDLGGDAGFARLVDVAHGLGVRVMPMFGIHGANVSAYPAWETAALRTRTDRMPTLVNKPDWDGDRSGEDDQVFLNPAEPGFGRHLADQVASVVDRFGVDGVFLDTSGCWFNDPRHRLIDGYRRLVATLRDGRPDLLVAGEGWFDALLGVFPVNQSWLGVDRVFRYPELLTRYGRAVGHLSMGAPGDGSTGVHEGGFYPGAPGPTAPGHLATVAVVDDTISRHGDEFVARCRAAFATAP